MKTSRYQRARYRTRQMLRAMQQRPNAQSERLARTYLNSRAWPLYAALSPRDQAHSARTAAILHRQGFVDRELIVAALLHDAGKGRQQLWHRVAFVLLCAGPSAVLANLARRGADSCGALCRAREHASLGAELARAAGTSERVAGLIAGHHQPSADVELLALQAADERA